MFNEPNKSPGSAAGLPDTDAGHCLSYQELENASVGLLRRSGRSAQQIANMTSALHTSGSDL